MIGLLYYTILTAFISDFVYLKGLLGPFGKIIEILPEIGSAMLLVGILIRLSQQSHIDIAPKYLVLATFAGLHLAFGAIVNEVSPGAVVAGLRDYVRFVPLFLLPAVIDIEDGELVRIFKLVVVLCLIQVPISVYQRMFYFDFVSTIDGGALPSDLSLSEYIVSGDMVKGTLGSGAMTSILLICCITVLVAFWIRGRISTVVLALISSVLVVPTLINETKASIILFAAGMLSLSILKGAQAKWIASAVGAFVASVAFFLTFAMAYDYFFPAKFDGAGLIEVYYDKVTSDQYKGIEDPYSPGGVPRIDSIVLAYRALEGDVAEIAFGKGLGNVSSPNRQAVLRGEYSHFFHVYNVSKTTYTDILWHLGLGGIGLILALTYFVFSDSKQFVHESSLVGTFALGWTTIMAILPIALLYKSLVQANALVVLMMFFSGYFAARRFRLARNAALGWDNSRADSRIGVSSEVLGSATRPVLPRRTAL